MAGGWVNKQTVQAGRIPQPASTDTVRGFTSYLWGIVRIVSVDEGLLLLLLCPLLMVKDGSRYKQKDDGACGQKVKKEKRPYRPLYRGSPQRALPEILDASDKDARYLHTGWRGEDTSPASLAVVPALAAFELDQAVPGCNK